MSDTRLPAIDPNWIREELARAPHSAGTVTIPGSTWAAVLELAAAHLREHGQMGEVHPATHAHDSGTPARNWDTGNVVS